MSEVRLQAQFSKIHDHFNGKDSDATLHDMAVVFCCTPRNARILLSKMALQRWLTWIPVVGRGKRSRLSFHCSESELQIKRVREWVKVGKLDAALEELNNDAAKLVRLIQEQLGMSTDEGKQIIRLPYYRAFPCLHPTKPLRRSEQHLAAQIFNCLTKINEKTGMVEPDLAHHWEAVTQKHWRFYLRPAVKFHDGRLLQAEDVIFSIGGLTSNDYFSHIERIETPANNVVDFHLHHIDNRFAHTLACHMASIQAREKATSKLFDRFPIGTGPYFVAENNEQQIVLKAHDGYFGLRALTDEIEIWVLDCVAMSYLQPTTSLEHNVLTSFQGGEKNDENAQVALDEGCSYLLLNRHNGIAKNPAWSDYLCQKLSSLRLFPYLALQARSDYHLINAYGLFPGWVHVNVPLIDIAPPSKTTLRLVHQQDNPLYSLIADGLKTALLVDGIELVVDVISYEEMMQPKQCRKIDIWLCGMSLGNKRIDAILAWIMNFGHFSVAMPKHEFVSIKKKMDRWREQQNAIFDPEELGRFLVNSGQMIPLFHLWLGVAEECDLEDLSARAGWFDFKSVWKKPLLLV